MPNINAVERFARVPEVSRPRSIFKKPCTHKTSGNIGDVIPIYCDIIYPGTTVQMSTSKVIRLQTMLTPIMDNIYADVFWFSVPLTQIWDHAREFFGENSSSAWIPQNSYTVPSISAPSGGFQTGTLADYFGLPVGIEWDNTAERRPMALPFRAYAAVMNEYFRSESLTDPLNIPTGDSNQTGTNGSSYISDVANGGKPFVAAKFFDRFTGCLPSPQKGPNVTFPLLDGNKAPVGTRTETAAVGTNFNDISLRWTTVNASDTLASGSHVIGTYVVSGSNNGGTYEFGDSSSPSSRISIHPTNLWADLSDTVGAVTVNQLRLAFQLQKYYEQLARSGSRYREILHGLWGTQPADLTMYVPEYLGGNRVPIQVHEVINQAQATNDYLGDLGAMSHTADVHYDFIKSFDQHVVLLGLCVLRYDHSYAQGIERFWSRLRNEDWYIPLFANLGEMPVYQDEICATDTNMATANVFGYQEAWSDLRYKQDRISGEMRPGIQNTLASWHLSDYYTQAPTLSDAWIREDKTMVDRVLAVTSQVSNQFFADFYFDATYTEVLPMYSVPGLIDHY